MVRSKGEPNAAALTGVNSTDALEGGMDCGREGREDLGDPGGEMGRAKGLSTGRVTAVSRALRRRSNYTEGLRLRQTV
jgi:hypothetical protein